jgi:hypothetical protein
MEETSKTIPLISTDEKLINLDYFCKSIDEMNNQLVNTKFIIYNIPLDEFPDIEDVKTSHSSTLSADESKATEKVTKPLQIDLKKNTLNFTNKLKSNIKKNLFGIQ